MAAVAATLSVGLFTTEAGADSAIRCTVAVPTSHGTQITIGNPGGIINQWNGTPPNNDDPTPPELAATALGNNDSVGELIQNDCTTPGEDPSFPQ